MNRDPESEIGKHSFAEGYSTTASDECSHAEGYSTTARGFASHAEGSSTIAYSFVSHAEGNYTIAAGEQSHAEGRFTIAEGRAQHVQGSYNVIDQHGQSSVYADIVGNGTSDADRKNIEVTTWTGDKRLKGDVYVHCNDDSTGGTKLVGLPDVTSLDNGKVLMVVNGEWALVTIPLSNGE